VEQSKILVVAQHHIKKVITKKGIAVAAWKNEKQTRDNEWRKLGLTFRVGWQGGLGLSVSIWQSVAYDLPLLGFSLPIKMNAYQLLCSSQIRNKRSRQWQALVSWLRSLRDGNFRGR